MNMELLEVLYQKQQGVSKSEIARSLGMSRNTVKKYLKSAEGLGLSPESTLPPREELVKIIQPIMPESQDKVRGRPVTKVLDKYYSLILDFTKMPHITIKQIWRLLKKDHGVIVGYNTVKRYVRGHFEAFYQKPKTTVRLEIGPGEQGQVDFGYVGKMKDPVSGKELKTWAFIMVLAYSRHRYVQFVHEMDTITWCKCHMRAFAFFGGVPQTVVLDNLKSGVLKADRYDPVLNRTYGELERHYGFVADPAKVRTPEHKGRVERQVPVIRQHFLAGRQFRDIEEANEKVILWCRSDIGPNIRAGAVNQNAPESPKGREICYRNQ